MLFNRVTGLLATTVAVSTGVMAHSEEDYDNMGPLGFMWPKDREWSEEDATNSPCGASEAMRDRTQFPVGEYLARFPPSPPPNDGSKY